MRPLILLPILCLASPFAGLAAPVRAESVRAETPDPISNARQLTFEGRRAGEGYYGPRGETMIFQSERAEDNPFYQMYLLDLTTGDVERLSTGVGKTTCGWIHPSGDKVLFASTQFDPEARAKMQAERDFRASGESRRYAWDYDPTYEIVEKDLATGDFTRLTEARGYDAEGAYSPDGSRIVFASNRLAYEALAAGDLSEAQAERLERDPAFFMDLYAMDADGSDVARLTAAPGYDGGPFWSADGSRITWRRFSEDGARAEIFVMEADGTDQRQVTDLDVMSWAPFFHPSGEYVVFSTNLQGFANFELYLVDAAGMREPVRVTEREAFDGLATFHPEGDRLSWTSNATGSGNSQIFVADWDHAAALALLRDAPMRERAEAAPAAPETPLPATAPEIAEADLRAIVADLASERMGGRLTGTEGERLATAYVADLFARAGLAPAGADATYFEPFTFTAGVALGDDNALSVTVDGATETLTLEEDWLPLGFSATGALPDAEVAFAGYGLQAPETEGGPAIDSYDGLDVEGKWVLVWRGLPGDLSSDRRSALMRYADLRFKTSVAKDKGAAGVVYTPPPRDTEFADLPRLTYEASMAGRVGLPVVAVDRQASARMLARLADREAVAAAVEAGEAAGGALPGVALAGTVALAFERREGRNVLGRLDLDGLPAGEGDAPVVVGAHVDGLGRGQTSGSLARADEQGEIHLGADDNASGVAAILEVAERMAAERAAGDLEGARDVVFAAWSGEELGLIGANHHVRERTRAAGTDDLGGVLAAYVNLDMVGRLREHLILSGTGSSPVWAREIERRNAVVGLPVRLSESPYLPTDSTAFYLAGVPILSLFTGAHDAYHTPRDTAETLNYDGLTDVTRFTALLLRGLATEAAAPEYVAVARPESSGARRMGNVYLGTIPAYAEEGVQGVPLSGVVKGGPAEEAGLTGGDVVVGLAGEDLDDIYDYVRTLNGLSPGEAVAITVERDGERLTLEIVPGRRE